MLIIGHRGAAGLAPENTLEALQAGAGAGADILEFDIRITKDKVPILAHDPMIDGKWISRHTFGELQKTTDITTLQQVLDTFFGKVLLNIELKQMSGTKIIYDVIELYVNRPKDWDNILFSSFKPRSLIALRKRNRRLNLALLHHINPFTFTRYHRQLGLSAVGFHRLHANGIAVAIAKELGIFTYVYTVDRPDAASRFDRKGIDGIVTNYPDKIIDQLQTDA